MQIQFLTVLATVSFLSFGAVTGCSSPTNTTAVTPTGSEVQADPCAAKSNPCAAKANPCAAKANPCAAKTDPCAAKANPCAAKAKSIGAPLAQQLQGKPVLVDVYASWCPACKNIAPTLSQLEKDYADKVHFVVLDVSDKSTTAEAEAKAKQLGLGDFLAAHKAQTGTLTIIEPATGKILAQHRNNANLADYTTVLDAAIAQ
ncbi:MAG: thioredoxin family protein [Leptolyngbyaceae cyanobacterium bins.349]|nr:thioredoxin family protein [Leptolyngbyaceae cyanobacterium bins.349]